MPILTSAFHLVFGRRGPRTRTPAPAPAAPPAPAPAPAPAAAAPPPPPAPAVPPAPVEPPPPPVAEAAAPPPAATEAPAPSPAPADAAPPPAETAPPAAEAPAQPPAEAPPATEATSPPPAEQPAAEQPAAEQPATEQPAAEQPAAERPAAEQPATAPSEPTPPAQPEVRPDVVAPAPSDALQLSPHFHLREFIVSDTARERGLDNSPDAHDLETLKRTAQLMEKVRTLLGNKSIHINSCYRNEQVNRAVGGVANSAHRLGHAVDFTCAAFGTPYQIVEFLKTQDDLMADVDQLIFERNVWVHISFEPRNPCRKQVLTAHRVRGQTTLGYVQGLVQLDADGYLVSA